MYFRSQTIGQVSSTAQHNVPSLAILRGNVGAVHPELDSMGEGPKGVIELTTLVTQDGLNGVIKLSGNTSEEVETSHKSIRLRMQRKSLEIMRAIIKNHRVIFIT